MSTAERLSDRVWRLELGRVNAYLVDDGDLTLFDAGTPGAAEKVVAGIGEAGYDVVDVDRVVITHYDLDHVGGLSGLTPDLSAPVIVREPDASYVTGSKSPSWGSLKGFSQRLLGLLYTPPDLRVERIGEGDEVGSFSAYHTPGHTEGHMAYVSRELDVAILGDLVRESGGRLEPSPWYISRDTDAVRESIQKLASRMAPVSTACPGHGDPITEGGADAVVAAANRD